MKKSIIFLAVAAFIVACGGTSEDKTSTSTAVTASADAPDGQKLYKTYCVTCHGLNGDMQGNGAIDLTKSALSLDERIKVISEGRTGTVMVGFKTLLDEAKVKALAEYVEKLRK
ncbi:MAG: c-type cytochrome [Saprospiraceae bacterium]|nr:c-type cytochrome [Saprospiraceae bacterium]